MTLAGFAAIFLLGRAGEPVRPLLLARQREAAHCGPVWNLYARTPVRLGKRRRHCRGRLLVFHRAAILAKLRASWKLPQEQQGRCYSLESQARSHFYISAAARIRSARAPIAGMADRAWLARHDRGNSPWLRARREAIQTASDLVLSVFLSAAHWFLVLLVYLWVSHSFGGLWHDQLGRRHVVMAFTLVGSAVQLPGVGGGSQVACFLAYTAVFGVEKEAAAGASIVVW